MAAEITYLANKVFVYFACKHHLNNICSFFVCNSKPANKFALDVHFFKRFAYFGAAAVNKYNSYSDCGKKHKVVHNGHFEFVVYHSVSAVFDYNCLFSVKLNVGKRPCKHFGFHSICNIHFASSVIRFCNRRLFLHNRMLNRSPKPLRCFRLH